MPDHALMKRHSLADRLIHWTNAVCWLILLCTGLALLDGESAPFGPGYPAFMRRMVSGEGNLLSLHIGLGIFWMCAFLVYIVTNFKSVRFFLSRIFQLVSGDGAWLTRQPFILALGKKQTAKLGISTEIPPQGYYNIGQRGFGIISIVGCITLMTTGLVMSAGTLGMFSHGVLSWSITIHFLAAGLVFAGLLIHVYMAALVRAERPGLISMFTGTVTEHYAKHHHGAWYEEVMGEGKK